MTKSGIKDFLLQVFTWWNGQTLGTRFYTWRKGELVGEDAFGNLYYRERGKSVRDARRWVVYNGEAEATRVGPGWHGWLHFTTDVPPTEDGYRPREWEKPPRPNMTGTPAAYHPKGSILTPETRPPVDGDYQAWTP
jgi:NADH:ubiquinone oxidoreductase subunit